MLHRVFEILPQDDSYIVQLCQHHKIDSNFIWGGAKISWDTSVDWGKPKQMCFTVLLPVANVDDPKEGKLLRFANNSIQEDMSISYVMGEDDVLTFTAEGNDIYAEERLWFASPNLRLRSNLEKQANGYSSATFYSEIRRMTEK